MSLRRLLLQSLGILAAAGCGVGHDGVGHDGGEKVGRLSLAVHGGVEEPALSYAVAIVAGPEPSTAGFRCSGTLIAPNVVLAARHCFAKPDTRGIDCTKDVFKPVDTLGIWMTTRPTITNASSGGWHRVREIAVRPEGSFCGNDIAVAILDDEVLPSEATPATPSFVPMLGAQRPTSVSVFGFGATTADGTDYGTRRGRASLPITCVPVDNTTGCGDIRATGVSAGEFVAGDGLCSGDSGAGAFDPASVVSGSPVVFGVVSRAREEGSFCGEAIYERIDHVALFIAKVARRAATQGQYVAPDWAMREDLVAPRALGQDCVDDTDCSNGGVCGSATGGRSYLCTHTCASDEECANGFACLKADAGAVGYCFAPTEANHVHVDYGLEPSSCSATPIAARSPNGVTAVAIAGVAALWRRRRSRRPLE